MTLIRLTEQGILTSQIADTVQGEFPYTLFLGAGASFTSGVPTTQELVEQWRREVYCHLREIAVNELTQDDSHYKEWIGDKENGYPKWLKEIGNALDSEKPYSTLFQYTRKTKEERQGYIEKLIIGKKASPGYLYLAGLIADKRINRILTTNFDDFVADTLMHYYQEKSIVCAFDSAVTSFNNTSLRPKIVKLHGDFLFENFNTDVETMQLSENMENKLIEMCEDKGLIVVGYAGNDDSIMTPLLENLRKKRNFLTKGLHWCMHMPSLTKVSQNTDSNATAAKMIDEAELPEKLNQMRKKYPDRVFVYASDGFDYLMQKAFTKCGLGLPPSILEPYVSNAAVSFIESCEALLSRNRLSPEMRIHSENALAQLDQVPNKYTHAIRRAQNLWGKGAELRDKDSNLPGAIKTFEQSISIVLPLLEKEDLTGTQRFQCISRAAGCKIGMYKCLKGDEGLAALNDVIELTNEVLAVEIVGLNHEELLAFASVQYNTMCALGHKATLAGEVSGELENEVVTLRNKMRQTPEGREKIAKLVDEPDILTIRYLLIDEQTDR